MGLILIFLAYIITALVMVLVGPILYYWVSKKIVKFNDPGWQDYVLFWLAWLLLNTLFAVFSKVILSGIDDFEITLDFIETYADVQFICAFVSQVLLAKWVFRESYLNAFKASLIYTILFSVLFGIVSVIAIFVGAEVLFQS